MMELTWYHIVALNFMPLVFSGVVRKPKHFTADYISYAPANQEQLLLQEKNYWWKTGEDGLLNVLKLADEERKHVARNVILFVGDGMGVTTATATRIYKGQRELGLMGEEHKLSFENFPNVALVKTYNVDKQVPDSAGTATAMFSGVKTRSKLIGLDASSEVSSFDKDIYSKSKLDSLMAWAQKAGKHTGVVTTTRITHATPASLYAKISHRDWECDSKIPDKFKNDLKDIARQLVEDSPGKDFKVILGGGLQQMGYVSNAQDDKCSREDHLNLTELWLNNHRNNSKFVTNNEGLDSINQDTEYLLGLFDAGHIPFELIRNREPPGTPSLAGMTQKALQILKKGPQGFVLMVEGGLIDNAHHKNFARLALGEAADFDEAVSLAVNETGPETLILVTSDHSHSVTMNGYAQRGNDILGYANTSDANTAPYLTISYANGPGYTYHYQPNTDLISITPWRNISDDNNRLQDPWYQHLATFYREDGTHGGEDVPIYAIGPGSHLVKGVIEQHVIAHIISYAACIGPQAHLNLHCA